jgi:hypothetical protein
MTPGFIHARISGSKDSIAPVRPTTPSTVPAVMPMNQ